MVHLTSGNATSRAVPPVQPVSDRSLIPFLAGTILCVARRRLPPFNYRWGTQMAYLFSALTVLAYSGCGNHVAIGAHENSKAEQILPLTFGGFLKDGPEAEQVHGICGPDETRNLLNCDIYNGLPGWVLTAVTLRVTWIPYEETNVRDYDVPVIIRPLTTENVVVRLGLQLPPDNVLMFPHGKVTRHNRWGWQNVGARGYPAK
jgi:hypothetical protein